MMAMGPYYLVGDWRSGAWGANKTAHIFVWNMSNKVAACGIKTDRTYRRHETYSRDACRECVSYIKRMDALGAEVGW
jgi:hypothetical protein